MNDSAAECVETLDPRVQVELERLNSSTDEINHLEVELDEARLGFRRLLAEGHIRIQQLTRKLGTSIHKARPYYEARFRANNTSQELQIAIIAYDKANSAHSAAREMVFLAEQGLARLAEGSAGGVTLDPAWQEMLNHATARVNQAEADRASTAATQRSKMATHRAAAALVQQLQHGLKRHIAKSRPYFEEKAHINACLEAQKAKIQTLEDSVADAKQQYSSALRNLERISDEIHSHRSLNQSSRNGDAELGAAIDSASDCADVDHSADETVRAWLRGAGDHRHHHHHADRHHDHHDSSNDHNDHWTEIDLQYSSPEEVSFEKCSLRARSSPSPPTPSPSPPTPSPAPPSARVSASSPRRIIRPPPPASAAPHHPAAAPPLHRLRDTDARRQSLDAILQDTGERVKEMFQGLSVFGSRRGSGSAPRTPRRAPSPRADSSVSDTERYSDTDSRASVEMLTDDQIASLMLDAQLEAVCERLAGVVARPQRSPQSPPTTANGHARF